MKYVEFTQFKKLLTLYKQWLLGGTRLNRHGSAYFDNTSQTGKLEQKIFSPMSQTLHQLLHTETIKYGIEGIDVLIRDTMGLLNQTNQLLNKVQ